LKDAFARLGYGTNRMLLEGLADQLATGSQFTDRAMDAPLPRTVQARVSERGHVLLARGKTDARSLGVSNELMSLPQDEDGA